MEVGLLVVIGVMAVAMLVLVVTRLRDGKANLSTLDARLESLNLQIGAVTGQSSTYQETLGAVNKSLGGLEQTSQRILEVGQDMQKLRDVLAAPTFRGGVGEMMLEALLRQTLPRDFYDTQHTFRNGYRVDAVIRLADGVVSVDAKFPLESFRRLIEAEDSDRKTHMSQFRRDVRRHVDDIAEKYICPGETLDFAMMYIPAENVYYEIVLKQQVEDDILDYAWRRRVIATSPNSLYVYLQVIALGLRGLQVEQNAKLMLDSLTRLKGDFDRFADDYRIIGTHLGHAKSKHEEAFPRLESIQRALPGQLRTGPAEEPPSLEDPPDVPDREPMVWDYSPAESKRGRQRES